MFFIYNTIFAVSLASKKKRARLCAIHTHCHLVPYFPFRPMDSHIEDCIV